jgi:hypothetical protein
MVNQLSSVGVSVLTVGWALSDQTQRTDKFLAMRDDTLLYYDGVETREGES